MQQQFVLARWELWRLSLLHSGIQYTSILCRYYDRKPLSIVNFTKTWSNAVVDQVGPKTHETKD